MIFLKLCQNNLPGDHRKYVLWVASPPSTSERTSGVGQLGMDEGEFRFRGQLRFKF